MPHETNKSTVLATEMQKPSRLCSRSALELYREVPGSSLCLDTGHPFLRFTVLLSSFRQILGQYND
jgi:hypothetical protein